MALGFWSWTGGTVQVEVTSAALSGTLSAMERAGIFPKNVQRTGELTLQFFIRRKDFAALQNLCGKRGEEISVIGKYGLFWSVKELLHRPILVLGMLSLLLLSLWVPGRVFFVFVQGNENVPSNLILEQASQCGIGFGALRREVRSEKIKNALLERMPQLQWAGINTQGCTAVISVREREESQKQEQLPSVGSIVATMDGIVREITVLKGTPLCTVGQAVRAGQVLISGYTDCGICIRANCADGEVYGETRRYLSVIFPTEYTARGNISSQTKKYSVIFGKKRINLSNSSGISGGECVRIYSEQYVTLPGGFRLPIAIALEQWICYETEIVTFENPESVLNPFITEYLQSQMIAGQIRNSVRTATRQEGYYRIDGIYGCYEMIGRLRPEESILDYENHRTDS